MNRDISDWRITFADTGIASNIGQRLKAVERHLAGESEFLANYADGLSGPAASRAAATIFAAATPSPALSRVRPPLTYHMVHADQGGVVRDIRDMEAANIRVNGGYFILRTDVFNHLQDGEELVVEPFHRLIDAAAPRRRTSTMASGCRWIRSRTVSDWKKCTRGRAPWEIWRDSEPARRSRRN